MFSHLSESTLQIVSMVVIAVFAVTVIMVRLQAAKKPTSVRKIIIPPLGMSTGYLMFIFPFMRISWTYGIIAFGVGLLFSIPLIISSHMEVSDGQVYLKRSPAFIVVLLVLLIVRLGLHSYIEKYVTIPQTGAVFFILAFGMLLPWRIAMYLRYKSFTAATASLAR
ncbi:MAG: cytochrome c biogenesis protein CcdC [Firmicutes bacterium]|nr:cytochrome c biogenesis protein CcdC [Bacillota bacterium]